MVAAGGVSFSASPPAGALDALGLSADAGVTATVRPLVEVLKAMGLSVDAGLSAIVTLDTAEHSTPTGPSRGAARPGSDSDGGSSTGQVGGAETRGATANRYDIHIFQKVRFWLSPLYSAFNICHFSFRPC